MIRTDAEYQEARARLLEERRRLSEHEARMKEMDLSAAERKRALDPLQSFSAQLEEEMEAYERAQRGSFEFTTNLHGLGRLLIGARIYRGLSQRELAGLPRRAQGVRLDHGGGSVSDSRGAGSRAGLGNEAGSEGMTAGRIDRRSSRSLPIVASPVRGDVRSSPLQSTRWRTCPERESSK